MIDIARGLLASEWTKLRSVQSTYLSLLFAAVATVGVSLLGGHAYSSRWDQMSPADRADFDPISTSLSGLIIAQLALAVLGALAMSSEHTTGMIRTTFAAVPVRRGVLAAKVAVAGMLAFLAGEVISVVAFLAGQAMLSGRRLGVSLADPEALRAVLAAGFYLVVVTVVGLALGAIIRHTAGAVAALFGLLLIVPQLVLALPASWRNTASGYLLSTAGAQLTSRTPDPSFPGVTGSLAVCVAWMIVGLGVAGVLITRRDA